MDKVLITGITGFLGAEIAKRLISENIFVIGIKRSSSDTWRCKDYEDKVDWIILDEMGIWKQSIVDKNPSCIIHCAWNTIDSSGRGDWAAQISNIDFLRDLIVVMQNISLSKVIFLGSQEEYGSINGKVLESDPPNPKTAYGAAKLASLELLRAFCDSNSINWIWLRVFSVFGEKDNTSWLIPSVINRMLTDNELNLSPGDQKYAYLYIKDFGLAVLKILTHQMSSGIYNLSGERPQSLKTLILKIRTIVNPTFQLNFGALPYRDHQSMHIEGDVSKIKKQIGEFELTTFDEGLEYTVSYYVETIRTI